MSYAEDMSKIWINDKIEDKLFDFRDIRTFVINRDSVCMGDDCCSHRTEFKFSAKSSLSELITYMIKGMGNIPLTKWYVTVNGKKKLAWLNLEDKTFELLVKDVKLVNLIKTENLEVIWLKRNRD